MMQVAFIGYDYFSYRTTTKVEIITEVFNRAPTITFCARYIEMMDEKEALKEKGVRILKFGAKGKSIHDLHYKQATNLTIRDIFKYTLPTDRLLVRCSVRKQGNVRMVLPMSHNKCQKSFKVTKFYMQSFVCYNFRPNESIGSFSINEIAHSYNYEMAVYSIYLPIKFTRSPILFLVLSPEDIPYVSRSYGAYLRTKLSRDMRAANDFMIQNKITDVIMLPPPYDSRCTPDYDFAGKTKCLIRAMEKRKLDRVPNSEIVLKDFDLHHVLWSDELNQTIKKQIDECYADCESISRQANCSYSFAETQVSMVEGPDFSGTVRLRIMGPQAPNVQITYHPKFKTSEFLLYVLTCGGIWLEMSVVRMNPLLLLHYLNKRLSRRAGRRGGSHDEEVKSVQTTGLAPVY